MVAVVLHATKREGVLTIGGQVDIELRGQLGSREVDIRIVLRGDVASIVTQHFQQETTGIREVHGVRNSLHSAIVGGAIGSISIEHQNLGGGGHVRGRGNGLGRRIDSEYVRASTRGDFIPSAQSAIGIDDIHIGDFSTDSADRNMLNSDSRRTGDSQLFRYGHVNSAGATASQGFASNQLVGTALSGQQAEVKQRVGGAEFALLVAFDFLLYHVRYT